jgi:alanine racemase
MSRASIAQIDLTALRTNLNRAKKAAPDSRIVAVVKSNAYGHGMLRVSHALDGTDAYGVARLDEAVQLREGGIRKPVVILEGFQDASDLSVVTEMGFQPVVHADHQLALIESELKKQSGNTVKVWLKLDTGMHRLGFDATRYGQIYADLKANPRVEVSVAMTHFACADDRNDSGTDRQIALFDQVAGSLRIPGSMANSAGLLGWPASRRHWVRPGIMLYGASPYLDGQAAVDGLSAVMTYKSELIAIHEVAAGESVGYGATWTATRRSLIGVVAAGYGDGYPRQAPEGTPVLVNGLRCPLAGRVSMDMLCVDLTEQPDANVGEMVTLWGEGLPVEEVAAHIGTIPYTLLCGITGRTRYEYL